MRQSSGGFARKTPRRDKVRAGRTGLTETPLRIRLSGVDLPDEFGPRARALLGKRLGRFATHIERATVRFKDINGPRGGVDTICRIQLTVSHRPTVLVEKRAIDAEAALKMSAVAAAQAMDRSVGRSGLRTPAPTKAAPATRRSEPAAPARTAAPEPKATAPKRTRSGRRRPRAAVGRGPEGRGKKRASVRMGYKLEDSAGKPSRKSTRKSASRGKSGSKLGRRERRKIRSPKARATRARIQRQRVGARR
jgi:hypothetical protein